MKKNLQFNFSFMPRLYYIMWLISIIVLCNGQIAAQTTYYCDPATGSMSNDGSESSPWSTLFDVFEAGKSFEAGDIIYLLDGLHGNVSVTGINTDYVTIQALDGHTPKLQSLKFIGASYWHVKGVEVSREYIVDGVTNSRLVYMDANSPYNIVEDSKIFITETLPATAAEFNAVLVDGVKTLSDYTTVKNCNIINVGYGVQLTNTSYNLIENNTINGVGMDGIQGQGSYNVIQYNNISTSYKLNTNHDDAIQFYTVGDDGLAGHGTSVGNEIRGNILYSDPNLPASFEHPFDGGLACFDGMYEDYIVENNIIVTNTYNGLVLYGAVNCKVVNNTVIDPDNSGENSLWIQIDNHKEGTASSSNFVANNLCTYLDVDASMATVLNNLVISTDEYSRFFMDFDNLDLHLKPGCEALDSGTDAEGVPSIDIEGNARPFLDAYDIGAYESVTPYQAVTGVSFVTADVTMGIRDPYQLSVEVTPSDATYQTVTYSSSDETVATVDEKGLITGLTGGITIITATTTDGGFTATCNVTVVYVPVTGITISPETTDANYEDIFTITTEVSPADASFPGVSYTSSNEEVAIVDENGVVYCVGSGTADITVTNDDKGITAVCSLVVNPIQGDYNLAFLKDVTPSVDGDEATPNENLVDGITTDAERWSVETYPQYAEIDLGAEYNISMFELYTYKGRDYQYTIELKSEGGEYETVVDRSANTDAIQPIFDEVSLQGRYVKITVTGAATYTGSWISLNELRVLGSPISVTGIELSETSMQMNQHESAGLMATVVPSNATNTNYVWASSNPAIVSVSNDGTILGLQEGSATISVTTEDGFHEATCDVTVGQFDGVLETPVADAYVRGLQYGDNNYGSAEDLAVKYSGYAAYLRQSFLKFDISNKPEQISKAILRMYAMVTGGGETNSLQLVSDDTWTEDVITYNNAPSAGSSVLTWTVPSVDAFVDIDVTSLVQDEADNFLSVKIVANSGTYTSYYSKEGSYAPQLIMYRDQSTGLKEKNNDDFGFVLYPNPTSSNEVKITFSGIDNGDAYIQIYNVAGEIIKTIDVSNASEDVFTISDLAKGIYIVVLENGNSKVCKKLLVE